MCVCCLRECMNVSVWVKEMNREEMDITSMETAADKSFQR